MEEHGALIMCIKNCPVYPYVSVVDKQTFVGSFDGTVGNVKQLVSSAHCIAMDYYKGLLYYVLTSGLDERSSIFEDRGYFDFSGYEKCSDILCIHYLFLKILTNSNLHLGWF